jgi:exonuclease SbcC
MVKMQILSIHLKNIKSHRDTGLTFSAGINVLSGPNGVGKSTVFEAIGYALFGVDARDFVSNVDRFISIGAKRGEISVVFQTTVGETWKVSRTVGTPTKWLLHKESSGSFEVEEHARIEETEARIAELLELNNGRPLAEQFKLVIGPFQNDFLGPFIIKQPTKRQEAFDEILGIDAWRKTYKGTSSLLSAVQEKMKILAVEITGKQEQLAVLPEKTTELAAVMIELTQRQKDLLEKEKSLTVMEGRLTDFEAVEKVIVSMGNDLAILEDRIKNGSVKITEETERVESSQKALQMVNESRAGKDAFDKVEVRLTELRLKEQQRRAVEQDIAGLEKQALTLSQKLEYEQTEIGKIDIQLAADQDKLTVARKELRPDPELTALASRLPELRKEVDLQKGERSMLGGRRESLLEGKEKLAEGFCPFFQEKCRNTEGASSSDIFVTRIDDLDTMTAKLDEKLKQLALQLKDAEAAEKELSSRAIRLQELDKQTKALGERFNKNKDRLAALDALTRQQAEASELVAGRKGDLKVFAGLDSAIAEADKERLQYQPAKDAYTANMNVAQDLDNRQQNLQKMLQLMESLTGDFKVKQAELAKKKQGFKPELLQQTRQDKEQLLADIATFRQQIVDHGRNAERLENEIKQLKRVQEDIAVKQLEIKLLEEKEKLVKFLRNQVFKNVSAQLSERFREEISLRADRIYRTIAETDEELYWGDNYQIVLKDMQDGVIRERSDDQLSGGQTMSAVVALRLALLQTIGARIAFFDEPTSNLDAARRENLAHAFRAIDVGREEVTEHWYDQLFLISHDVAFTEITDQMLQIG